ncbi:MAG: DoxX family protein [Subtercola sp.]|nr:DoxX family protein [Subtercola sp.]
MNVTLWIVQILLAAAFFVSGIAKVIRPSEKLKAGLPEFHPSVIRLIAVAEILGALGLILPGATGTGPILTPVAAIGLAIIMIGAVVTHARRKEGRATAVNLVLLVLTIVVAIGRFALPVQ